MENKENPVTWFQVNNIFPIITSTVMIVIAFGAIWTRLALIEQSQDTIKSQQASIIEFYKSVENRYGEIALEVNTLQVKSHSH